MDIERLKAIFEIKDGRLVNKISRGSAKAGSLAGYVTEDNYRRARVDGKYFYVHIMLWRMEGNSIPDGFMLDHIDGDRQNNVIANLRLATSRENQHNKFRQKEGTSEYKGVWYDAKKSKWKAAIRLPESRLYIGQFETELEAALAYDEIAREIHGEFAKLNIKLESTSEAL